jgi:heme-degrading monooxygenase HmoA
MKVALIIVRYPKWLGWAGFLSMAIFRFALWFNPNYSFWKLMGCGRNGTFDKTPDWRQWAVLLVGRRRETRDNTLYPIPYTLSLYWRFFGCEKWELQLTPIEGHGLWDGKEVFGNLPRKTDYEGPIAVLTRATIRLNKLHRFWKYVDPVASQMATAKGFITSVGIGEVPWIKQATFSIWESKEAMKTFAYALPEHAEVIRKTHTENWYSEELFVRFKIEQSTGNLNGKLPFQINP